jgi:hypothetical protein
MKKFPVVFIAAVFLAMPVFSQNTGTQRFRNLSDSMGNTVSSGNSKLANYDEIINDNGNIKTYTSYLRRFEGMAKVLQDKEARLDLLIRTNDKTAAIKEERDNYEGVIKRLDAVKSEYDGWLRGVE